MGVWDAGPRFDDLGRERRAWRLLPHTWRYGLSRYMFRCVSDLLDWSEIADAFVDAALLTGNGLSACASKKFTYGSLFEEARSLGVLSAQDLALFETFDTEHFELVLGNLLVAQNVMSALGKSVDQLHASYGSVRRALGSAVQSVHISYSEVSGPVLADLFAAISAHRAVFTTSYDLLLYWAMAAEGFTPMVDLMWSDGVNAFDPDCWVAPERVPIYYLHGALHLAVDGAGRTRKHCATGFSSVLDQFGKEDPEDPDYRPLFVSEGSHEGKLREIASNAYLTYCREKLKALDSPLVVFGFAFGEQDRHIADAIERHPGRAVAVSMRRSDPTELRRKQLAVQQALPSQHVRFFDADSHPLSHAFT